VRTNRLRRAYEKEAGGEESRRGGVNKRPFASSGNIERFNQALNASNFLAPVLLTPIRASSLEDAKLTQVVGKIVQGAVRLLSLCETQENPRRFWCGRLNGRSSGAPIGSIGPDLPARQWLGSAVSMRRDVVLRQLGNWTPTCRTSGVSIALAILTPAGSHRKGSESRYSRLGCQRAYSTNKGVALP
jgi:hypothetical protein